MGYSRGVDEATEEGDLEMSGHLVLTEDAGGHRHELDGRPVHAGDELELQLSGGTWIAGRYEWTYDQAKPAVFVIPLMGAQGRSGEPGFLPLPESAVLQWPGA